MQGKSHVRQCALGIRRPWEYTAGFMAMVPPSAVMTAPPSYLPPPFPLHPYTWKTPLSHTLIMYTQPSPAPPSHLEHIAHVCLEMVHLDRQPEIGHLQ